MEVEEQALALRTGGAVDVHRLVSLQRIDEITGQKKLNGYKI